MTSTSGKPFSNAPGVLLVLHDVAPDADEDEFNRWYQQQHLPERLAVPGFHTAKRYRAVDAQAAYMAVYECASIGVFTSKAYLERLANPTDWTRKIMPGFRNMLRSTCRETWSSGRGTGGGSIIVQCKPVRGREDDARCHVKDTLAAALMQSACLVRVALWEADAAFSGGTSPEMVLRGGADKSADWVLFLESYDHASTAAALDAHLRAGAAADAGLLLGSRGRYQLIYAVTA